jgi:hypothetical protein
VAEMRSLKALRGLAALSSSTLAQTVEIATRGLSTAPDLKSVLKEKIPEQQVHIVSSSPLALPGSSCSVKLVQNA